MLSLLRLFSILPSKNVFPLGDLDCLHRMWNLRSRSTPNSCRNEIINYLITSDLFPLSPLLLQPIFIGLFLLLPPLIFAAAHGKFFRTQVLVIFISFLQSLFVTSFIPISAIRFFTFKKFFIIMSLLYFGFHCPFANDGSSSSAAVFFTFWYEMRLTPPFCLIRVQLQAG